MTKLLFDFFPIFLFFVAYKFSDIYVATAVAIAASVAQVGWFYFKHRRVETLHIVTLVLIVVLGGATLIFKNEMFIKWKPTVVDWVFAAVFFISQFYGEKTVLERLMAKNIALPKPIWNRLNMSWVLFFTLLGGINLYVVYHFDTDTWVNFKLFGMMGLTVLFALGQGVYLSRHVKVETETPPEGP